MADSLQCSFSYEGSEGLGCCISIFWKKKNQAFYKIFWRVLTSSKGWWLGNVWQLRDVGIWNPLPKKYRNSGCICRWLHHKLLLLLSMIYKTSSAATKRATCTLSNVHAHQHISNLYLFHLLLIYTGESSLGLRSHFYPPAASIIMTAKNKTKCREYRIKQWGK